MTVAFEGEGAPPFEVIGQVICAGGRASPTRRIHFVETPDNLEAVLNAIP